MGSTQHRGWGGVLGMRTGSISMRNWSSRQVGSGGISGNEKNWGKKDRDKREREKNKGSTWESAFSTWLFVFCNHFSMVHHKSSEASLGALEQTWMLSLLG